MLLRGSPSERCWCVAFVLLLSCPAGFAINAAVAFERQLAQMFFPLLSLATIVRNNPSYERFNASFDSVAQELMSEVRDGQWFAIII